MSVILRSMQGSSVEHDPLICLQKKLVTFRDKVIQYVACAARDPGGHRSATPERRLHFAFIHGGAQCELLEEQREIQRIVTAHYRAPKSAHSPERQRLYQDVCTLYNSVLGSTSIALSLEPLLAWGSRP